MRKLDKLIVTELLLPWAFGVAIFTVLILAGTYLFKITDYIVQGIPPMTVGELSMLLLPGIMAKTFPMAMLLATLLGFGRLSGDSEVVALRASGVGLFRIMAPVLWMSIAVAFTAFCFNEFIVPRAALRASELQSEITKELKQTSARPTFYAQTEGTKLIALIAAADFSLASRKLRDASIVLFDKSGNQTMVILAEELYYSGEKDWKLTRATLLGADGVYYAHIESGWPKGIQKMEFTPEDILAQTVKDLDSFSMPQILERIAAARANPTFEKGQIANLEFGYWNKIALPLAAIVFALVGAPLGIRNHRTGSATGFWQSVVIIFAYMMLSSVMATSAIKGNLAPAAASFTPIAIGLVFAAYMMYKKNN